MTYHTGWCILARRFASAGHYVMAPNNGAEANAVNARNSAYSVAKSCMMSSAYFLENAAPASN